MPDVSIVWFRRNLRLTDNPPLAAALASGDEIVPVYVWSPDEEGVWSLGTASRAWLAHSLAALDRSLAARGSRLVIRVGPSAETLAGLAAETGARTVYADWRFEPGCAQRDARVSEVLAAGGTRLERANATLLREPTTPLTHAGEPYRVFTPYFEASKRAEPPPRPTPAPDRIPVPTHLPAGEAPDVIAVGAGGAPASLADVFEPGETGALRTADRFLAEAVERYADGRDRPDLDATSRLSPHLAFGEIGPAQLYYRAHDLVSCDGVCRAGEGAAAFIRQLYWREFAYHLLHHYPHTVERPLRRRFEVLPWSRDPEGLEAWKSARTGYPLVDAGMRELLATGWMHNRVRMVVASFLTKDLLLPWLEGARFFWQRLADADLANNTFGWQWVAGCGADAAPYFRIFNPVKQGEQHDPDGAYVRRWVPELTELPASWIHRPWDAPAHVLAAADVTLGTTYPRPIVDHAEARARALAVYGSVKDVVE